MNIFAFLLLVLTKCSVFNNVLSLHRRRSHREDIKPRVVGGQEAIPHSHPYMISLQQRILFIRYHFCGGTLIKESWILTAAHCIKQSWLESWLPIDAIAGAHSVLKCDSACVIIPISKRICHPDYTSEEKSEHSDIAILKTKYPFEWNENIKPARLPMSLNIGHNLKLIGWGLRYSTLFNFLSSNQAENLQELDVSYIPYKECLQAFKSIDTETYQVDEKSHICTGPITGGLSGCHGDSGGPLLQYTDNRRSLNNYNYFMSRKRHKYHMRRKKKSRTSEHNLPLVIGVVSFGAEPCGRLRGPTVFTNVFNYIEFINQHIDAD